MKRASVIILFYLFVLTVIEGFAEFHLFSNHSQPLYGRESLSKEEKLILTNPFVDYRQHNYDRKAYKVAMICLKHRLTLSEVQKAITGPVQIRKREDTGGCDLIFMYWGEKLKFYFDSSGHLDEVYYHADRYRLPPIEFITPDTPIEVPPLPRWGEAGADLPSNEGLEMFRKLYTGADSVVSPPDFDNLAFADAQIIVEAMIYAVRDVQLPVVANYSWKVITQLRKKKISDENKALAIYLLSKITPQDTNTVAVSIEQIDFKVNIPDGVPRWVTRWSSYPARDALLRTGEASVGPIVQDLPGETNALRRQLLCAVVSTFGRTNWTTAWQPKPAIEQLQRLRSTESEQSRQQNIDAALELLIDNKVDLNIGWSGYLGE